MSEIVLPVTTNEEGIPVICTLDFAIGLGIQHKNLLETVRTYQTLIEKDFGRVRFETRPLETAGGTQQQVVAFLTEDQSLFIGSLSRNSERVVEFKSVLVRSFAAARKKLAEVNLPSYQIDDEIERAKRWIEEQKQVRALQFENAELKPKAQYAEQVLLSETELTTTKVALDLGMSARKLNKLLEQKGVQYRQSGIWNLKAAYNGKGYAKLRTYHHPGRDGSVRTEHLLVWTEKGREFIHGLLNPALSTNLSAPTQLALA